MLLLLSALKFFQQCWINMYQAHRRTVYRLFSIVRKWMLANSLTIYLTFVTVIFPVHAHYTFGSFYLPFLHIECALPTRLILFLHHHRRRRRRRNQCNNGMDGFLSFCIASNLLMLTGFRLAAVECNVPMVKFNYQRHRVQVAHVNDVHNEKKNKKQKH